LALGLPTLIASEFLHVHFWPSPSAWMTPPLLVSLATYLHLRAFRCPRCGRRDGWPQEKWGGLVRSYDVAYLSQDTCFHCGILVGTAKSAVVGAEKTPSTASAATQPAGPNKHRL
jgi:hypothetical protein